MTLSLKTVHVMYMAALLSLSVTQVSAAINGTYFSHKNWEVACDNTGTCRAVGYQADDHAPAAVLLTRQAGANTATQVALSFDPEVSRPIGVELWIGQRKVTHIRFTEDIGRLSSQHANLVLNAIKNDQPVSLRAGQQQWRISGSGAHAVMLKMDDVQKRTATTSALLKTGQKPVTHVLAAQAKPKIQIPRIISQSYSIARQSPQGQQLIKMLRQSTSAEQCGFLHGNNQQADQIQVFNLNAQTRLVQIPCWMAAYNSGDGFWLMDTELKKVKQRVTTSAQTFEAGQIYASQRGRGIGDCGSENRWAWNGQTFVPSYAAKSTLCKGFIRGIWDLPTYVSDVVKSK